MRNEMSPLDEIALLAEKVYEEIMNMKRGDATDALHRRLLQAFKIGQKQRESK